MLALYLSYSVSLPPLLPKRRINPLTARKMTADRYLFVWQVQSDKTAHLDASLPLLLITIEGESVRTAHYTAVAAMMEQLGLSHHVGVIVPEGAAHRDAFAGALASVRDTHGVHA